MSHDRYMNIGVNQEDYLLIRVALKQFSRSLKVPLYDRNRAKRLLDRLEAKREEKQNGIS